MLIGDVVVLRKAGDVIPRLLGPVADLRTGRTGPLEFPNSALHRLRDSTGPRRTRGSLALPNARVRRGSASTVSAWRGALDIRGARIRQPSAKKILTDEGDLLLQLSPPDLPGVPFFVNKQGTLTANTTSLWVNPGTGRSGGSWWRCRSGARVTTAAGPLAAGSVDAIAAAPEAELVTVEDVGPTIARSLRDWFEVDWHAAIIKVAGRRADLATPGFVPRQDQRATRASAPAGQARPATAGVTVVLTQGRCGYSRDEAAGKSPGGTRSPGKILVRSWTRLSQ